MPASSSAATAMVASAWLDQSLFDPSERQAVQLGASWRTGNTDARVAIAHFTDHRADGTKGDSTVLEAGATQRLFANRLELGVSTSIALDQAEAADLPARHRLRARYAATDWLRLVAEAYLTPEQMEAVRSLGSWEEIMQALKDRLAEQQERH